MESVAGRVYVKELGLSIGDIIEVTPPNSAETSLYYLQEIGKYGIWVSHRRIGVAPVAEEEKIRYEDIRSIKLVKNLIQIDKFAKIYVFNILHPIVSLIVC